MIDRGQGPPPIAGPAAWARVRLIGGRATADSWQVDSATGPARITVGSDPRCGWRVEGGRVAPLHVELSWDGGRLWIADPRGVGGVTLDGVPVSTNFQPVPGRARIEFGEAAMLAESSVPAVAFERGVTAHPASGPVAATSTAGLDDDDASATSLREPASAARGARVERFPAHAVPTMIAGNAESPSLSAAQQLGVVPPVAPPLAARPGAASGRVGTAHLLDEPSTLGSETVLVQSYPMPGPVRPASFAEPNPKRGAAAGRGGQAREPTSRTPVLSVPLRTWLLLAATAGAMTVVLLMDDEPKPARRPAPASASAPVPVPTSGPAPDVAPPVPDPEGDGDGPASPAMIGLEREAADLLIAGRQREAMAAYRRLARERPDRPAFAAIARILERRLRSRCDPSTPGGPPCAEPR